MIWVLWNIVSVRLETVLVSVQDRFMVCAKNTIGLEIILDAPNGTPKDVGHVECHFGPFGHSVNLDAR